MQLALERILVIPQFLFRLKGLLQLRLRRSIGLAMLSWPRASHFSMSSIPDEELLKLGVEGKLKTRRSWSSRFVECWQTSARTHS